ncbi:hypothetical protein Bhyg_00145, partial [Pseudolycoriella hygida]
MNKLIHLIKWDYLIQNRINNLSNTTLINDQTNIKKFGVIFSIILFPIALINFSQLIFRPDLEDGNLELLLISFTENEIILSKFLTICFIALSSVVFNMPIIYLLFDITTTTLLHIFMVLILLLILASALLILIAAIQSYFRTNNALLSLLIMPLLIPNIIFSGIIIQNPEANQLAFSMLGVNIILLPIILFLSSYLIANIYNI